ncbi:camphor resistance protein CrcB [Aureimonas ureilytica]|uniref:Fluoride-specific ion channel FluC n=1 Tax=Aureimonas ureilytica TaxID=401562 RepID=A0A175RRZ2_9HYPH|nr:fluoride efflux transporter CrcB [Aureimonas ureilytica]KTR06183.1 camphor resistance protein CrcB [Aureimonas ureilytica]
MGMNWLLVALGGGLGSVLRYGAGLAAARWLGTAFPFGTLFVNVTGSFAMGVLVEFLARRYGGADANLRLLLATGVLGGYTTFSSFSLDFATLAERGELATAFVYLAVTILAGLGALFAGLALARQVF